MAIDIAVSTGLPLKIAAKIDEADRNYWTKTIQPKIAAHENIEFIGEIDEQQKQDFLGNALALLFPIDWPEPFGLVMIEAMACGTPVIAFDSGAVPEVVDQGVTGFVVSDMSGAIAAVPKARQLDRPAICRRFEQHFSAARMAREYVAIYRKLQSRVDASA